MVTGSVVAVIGLNLAGIPIKNMAASNFDSWMQAVTFVCVGLVAGATRGMVQRLLILVGLIAASIVYAVLTNGMGLANPAGFVGPGQCALVWHAQLCGPGVQRQRHAAHRPGGHHPGGWRTWATSRP